MLRGLTRLTAESTCEPFDCRTGDGSGCKACKVQEERRGHPAVVEGLKLFTQDAGAALLGLQPRLQPGEWHLPGLQMRAWRVPQLLPELPRGGTPDSRGAWHLRGWT